MKITKRPLGQPDSLVSSDTIFHGLIWDADMVQAGLNGDKALLTERFEGFDDANELSRRFIGLCEAAQEYLKSQKRTADSAAAMKTLSCMLDCHECVIGILQSVSETPTSREKVITLIDQAYAEKK